MKKRMASVTSINKITLQKIANPHKIKILETLQKKDKINQSQINDQLDISLRQTRRYLNSLQDLGLLKQKKQKKERGQPVLLSLRK